jgi:flavin reductase (DIM6/NTAB) family NADH-FMN oxidoreductase RutF
MERLAIPAESLRLRCCDLWDSQWLLLAAGDFAAGDFNAMTVSWGGLGTLWNRPFAQVVVRPTRYTYGFMERYPDFTLSAFPERLRPALMLLGSRSGRDGDKIRASGLTPIAASRVAAPAFAEAELVIECRKLYWSDIAADRFLDPAIDEHYPLKDYHRAYVGEILAVAGTGDYRD